MLVAYSSPLAQVRKFFKAPNIGAIGAQSGGGGAKRSAAEMWQMAASKALGNQDEYKEWLRTYANALGEQVAMRPQLTGAVHELCDELLGPLDVAEKAEEKEGVWSPKVIGLSKRELLRDVVLPSLATNRSLQRILEEYIEQLAAVSS